VLTILWQSRILVDGARRIREREQTPAARARLLLSRSVLMFFAFFMVSAMAGAGIQSWLITILHQVHGLAIGRHPRR
jgi:FSR family fosmidomycin resistance protein-like MFS transporter